MPNSWEKITLISPDEEESFIRQNEYPIRLIKGMAEKKMPEPRLKIYRQTVLDLDFYRVIFSPPEEVDFLSSGRRFFQGLVYSGQLLCVGVYNFLGSKLENSRRVYYYFYDSIDIHITTKGAIGVLLSTVKVPSDQNGSYFIKTQKGQCYGYPEACYFLVDSLPERVFLNQWYNADNCWPRIPNTFIYASECLVDKDMPLRYGLQNAFDNNPATSYVENTNDDLFRVFFDIRDERLFNLEALAVINGYAQNDSLYYSNNRVKRIRYTFSGWVYHNPLLFLDETALRDNYEPVTFPERLTYFQTYFAGTPPARPTDDNNINVIYLGLYINDIYPGNRYNDTCVAEINLLCDEGWLFGPVE
jgi:hypothetical protein